MRQSNNFIYKIIIQITIIILIFTGCSITRQQEIVKPIAKIEKYKIKSIVKVIKKEPIQHIEKPKIIQKKIEEIPLSKIEDKKIAIIFSSSTIGKYALEAVNSMNTYLLYKNKPFNITALDMVIQNEKNLIKVFNTIKEKSIKNVIAMITKDNLNMLNSIEGIKNIKIYLPLINKSEIKNLEELTNLNIIFGAISYQNQFNKLIDYTNNLPLVEFYDNTAIGTTLHKYLNSNDIIYQRKIDDNNGRYKRFLKRNKKLYNSALILNTPLVKSSILLSAITAEQIKISKIISTQLNYTPLLLSLTQVNDRRKLIIANSIGELPSDLEEYNNLVGNNILYSWVNYSVIVGTEYLLFDNIDFFKDLSMENNQIIYPVKLYKVGKNSFELIN
jgi:hypothetical protein